MRISNNASKRIEAYEELFEETIENIELANEYLQSLSKRELLSNDPDIQMVNKIIKFFHASLVNYAYRGKDLTDMEVEVKKGKDVYTVDGKKKQEEEKEEEG